MKTLKALLLSTAFAGVACTPAVNTGGPPARTSGGSAPPPATRTPVTPPPSSAPDYRRIEREVLTELNAARTNPPGYAAHLSALLPLFNGDLIKKPGMTVSIRTREGAAAVREAIDALKRQAPVPPLTMSSGMSLAAGDLVNDQRRTGAVGHTGSDGSSPASRLAAHGTWLQSYSENIDYGPFLTARDVVVDLLVDDGVPDRGHRRNIFDGGARVAGIACGSHPRLRSMCVIDQAGGYVNR
jgi:uncharacterized protein YkwD